MFCSHYKLEAFYNQLKAHHIYSASSKQNLRVSGVIKRRNEITLELRYPTREVGTLPYLSVNGNILPKAFYEGKSRDGCW